MRAVMNDDGYLCITIQQSRDAICAITRKSERANHLQRSEIPMRASTTQSCILILLLLQQKKGSLLITIKKITHKQSLYFLSTRILILMPEGF